MGEKAWSAAITASLGAVAGTADAEVFTATLVEVRHFSNFSPAGRPGDLSASTAVWTYDDVTGLLSQSSGTYVVRFATSAAKTLFRVSATGIVLGNGGAASATTFTCAEGNFGYDWGASLCGNYSFGGNFVNESATSWGPGASTSRELVGDDEAFGPQQGTPALGGLEAVRTSGYLILSNATCTGACSTLPAGAYNDGQQWTLTLGAPTRRTRDDVVAIGPGLTVDIYAIANDAICADPTTISLESAPDAGGTAEFLEFPWRFRYTPAPGFVGIEAFQYRMNVQDCFNEVATVFVEVVDPATNPDTDADGMADRVDNCLARSNPDQCDSNRDGYGNRCDADLSGNGVTNSQDITTFRASLGRKSPAPASDGNMAADINCNGVVNAQDATLFRQLLGSPPGPSGRAP